MRALILALCLLTCGAATPTTSDALTTTPHLGPQCAFTTKDGAVRHFYVFDNTFYPNVDLESYGLIKSNVVYEPPAMKATTSAGRLPDAASFKTLVRDHALYPGPVVLDFENLYLQGTPAVASAHFRVLDSLAEWAHQAAPGKVIGFYGLLDHTDLPYLTLAKRLVARENAFFPSLYTFNDDRAAWAQRVRDDMALARSIAPRLPVYLYVWPQYHEHTPKALQYVSSGYWSFQLRTAATYANGVVIWSGSSTNTNTGWVSVTAAFMRACKSAKTPR